MDRGSRRIETRIAVGVLVAGLAAAGTPACANLITFSFDEMAYRSSSSPGANADVLTYMQSIWSAGGGTGTLIVTGAGALSNNRYTGDNHVVGPYEICVNPAGNSRPCNFVPATLGSTEGGIQGSAAVHPIATSGADLDNYIVNSGSDRITVVFPTAIYSASFDFAIFPDGTCTDDTTGSCGGTGMPNWPDFKFLADGVQAFLQLATAPGTAGTYCESQTSNLNNAACEPAPQYLGVSGLWLFPGGVTTLEFVDWPRRIGIDNLIVGTTPPAPPSTPGGTPQSTVPEPGGIALFAAALAGLAIVHRRRATARV